MIEKCISQKLEHLKASFDITVLEWTRAFKPDFEIGKASLFYKENGYRLNGKKNLHDSMALERLDADYLNRFDAFFILNDVWNIDPVLNRLQLNGYKGKVICYFPVDAAQHDPDWYKNLAMALQEMVFYWRPVKLLDCSQHPTKNGAW